ncbi:hypothetical protein SCANM124S_01047 [Streptomyces canus]
MTALAIGDAPIRQAAMRVLHSNRKPKFCANPARTPNRPPRTVVITRVARRPVRPASQTQNGPVGTEATLPSAASVPRLPLVRPRATEMDGKRVAVALPSVLSTEMTPVRVRRLRQRWGTREAETGAVSGVAVGAADCSVAMGCSCSVVSGSRGERGYRP